MAQRQDRLERRDGVPPSEAVEDYAKAIYALQGADGATVGTTALAERLDVSPASASAMVRRLQEMGLVDHERYRGARLTPAGEKVALEVMRHHRLIESYLAEALGMSWDRVHDEAEVLEHYISEDLERLIADKLGHPERDPHGDPIPTAELAIGPQSTVPLVDLEESQSGIFTQVSDSDSEMLRYLAEREIVPGKRITVTAKQPFDGPLFVEVDGREHVLGGQLANAMQVVMGAGG